MMYLKQSRNGKPMIEIEINLKVKCLRFNNGGEYIYEGFKEYCVVYAIIMEKSILGTPQENGIVERMNRTINERARSMKLHDGLPLTFWANAINITFYMINCEPSIPLECKLPEEA